MSNDKLPYNDLLQDLGDPSSFRLDNLLNDDADDEDDIASIKHSDYYSADSLHESFKSNSSSICIMSLNAQSIRAKFDSLKILLTIMENQHVIPDVICIQETWLDVNDNVQCLNLEGYNMICQPFQCSRHGGLLTYVKNCLNVTKIEFMNNASDIWEGLFVRISCESFNKDIDIINIYKPPKMNNNRENVNRFINEIDPLLKMIGSNNNEIILAGDFNINLLKVNERPEFAHFLDTLLGNSLHPKITLPTRIGTHCATLIDNFFCRLSSSNNAHAGIIFSKISDHFPYLLSFPVSKSGKNNTKTKFIKKCVSGPSAHTNMLMDLHSNNIRNSFTPQLTDDPNPNCDIFLDILKEKKETHFPTILVKFNKRKHKQNKWITQGIINSINYRDKLYRDYKSDKNNDYQKLMKKQNLSVYNVILKKMIREAKCKYYDSKFAEYKGNLKKTWGVISEILCKDKKNKLEIDKINCHGSVIKDPKQIANRFNEYFINVGPTVCSQIDISNKKSFDSYITNRIYTSLTFQLVSSEDISKIIRKFKPKPSSGHDGISLKLLKFIAPAIIEPLTHLVNQSLVTGIFPDKLKVAKVLPLFKKGDSTDMGNYRPISLLTSISKVFEKVVFNQLYDYFHDNRLFYYFQYGFRPKHSTEFASLEFVDRIYESLDKKENPVAIYMDLSKAFDTINHKILLSKLK